MTREIPCAAGVVVSDGRLLLVRRAHDPQAGRWSLPGGHAEWSETSAETCAREVFEETGLEVEVGRVLGEVRIPGSLPDTELVVVDHECRVLGGRLVARDDAADVRWFTPSEVLALSTTTDLVEHLTAWGVLPA